MGMTIFELVGKIAINKGTADKDIDETTNKGKTLASQFDTIAEKAGSFAQKATVAGGVLTAALTVPLVIAGKKAIGLASDYEEALNKTDVAFGNSAQKVVEFSETSLKTFGISKGTALDMASLFGDMATSMGLPQDAAADMSVSMSGLAGDLSSFKNIPVDQAMTALNGVFTGETESLKQVGVVMTQTNLDAYALANGFGKTTDEMTQSEQVQLRYAYVMNATKNAQGDYARTADGTANSLRTFQGTLEELGTAFGQVILPVITPMIQKGTELLNKIKELPDPVKKVIVVAGGLAASLGPLILVAGRVAGAIKNIAQLFGTGGLLSGITGTTTATGGMGAALGTVLGPIAAVAAGIAAFAAILIGVWKNSEKFRAGVVGVFLRIRQQVQIAFMRISEALEPAKAAFRQFWESVGPVLQQVGDFLAMYILPIIQNFATYFIGAFTNIIIGMAPFLTAIGNLFSFIANFVGMVFALFNGDWNGAMEFGKKALQSLLDAVVNIWNGIWGTISAVMNAIFAFLSAIWGSIVGTISNLLTSIWNNITTAWNNIINTTQRILGNLMATVVDGFQGAIDFITGLPGKFLQYGKDMIQSLIDGVNNMITGAKDAIVGIANGIKDAFCEALGIHSPSTWFSDMAGHMVQGLVNGWKNSHFAQWVDNTVEWMKEKFKGSTDAIMGFFSKMGSGALDFLKNTLGIDLTGLFGGGAGVGSSLGWIWPSDTTEITDYFGNRESPGGIGSTNHQGIDIGAAYGTPIYAPSSGTVEIAGGYGGYGNAVKLDMGGGFETLFGHMSSVAVSVGQAVSKGQVIGYVGSTGNSTGPHIHYSVFVNGQMVDPMDFYAFANGGIVDRPTWGVFGEAGKEANIPLQNNRARGIALWKESGRILGMTGGSSDEDGLAAKIGTAVAAALKAAGITGTNLKIETNNYTPNPSPSETERATLRALRKAGLADA
ncbi:Peptidase family M23 [Eubacterium aggregans]|uniref:Peptidase family M23 n=2 Tax=Eubacterium aggregans TaxID=81409 RepID=A0A1H3YWR0_9FIRM|nr:Peptidase family M23 [Eubacterium aggregans]